VSANLLPVAKLHQIKSAQMKPADEQSFQNLLYVSKTDSPRKLTLKRLEAHTALVEGDALLAVAGKAGCKIPGGETDAKACYMGADALALAVCTSFKLGAASLTSAKPVSLELGLKSGKLRVASAEATSITLPPNVIPVPAGGGTFDVRPESVQMLSHGLQQALQLATKQVAPSETRFLEENGFLRRLTPLLKLSDLGGEVYVALPADLNNDGKPELLLGVGNHCLCLDGAGKELWRVETLAPVKALFAYDLDKDGKLEVICGSNDEHVRILSAAGKLIRQWKVDAKIVSGQGHESRPLVNTLYADDADSDGKTEVYVGTMNCHFRRYTPEGELVWDRSGIYHGSQECRAYDLDGDGKKELMVGNRYGAVHILAAADGKPSSSAGSELGDVQFDFGDLDGDGKVEIVNGSSTGALKATQFRGPVKWEFSNSGFGVRDVVVAKLTGGKTPEVLVASETGYLYVLDGAGKEVWRANVGDAVMCIAVADFNKDGSPEVALGAADGTVRLYSAKGDLLALAPVGGIVKSVQPADLNSDGRPEILYTAEGGLVGALAMP